MSVCVRPGWKPRRPVFSRRGSGNLPLGGLPKNSLVRIIELVYGVYKAKEKFFGSNYFTKVR